jgi:chemotaxis protein CheD
MTAEALSFEPPVARERMLHVVQGEYAVVAENGVVLTTILGSCVATCLWDPESGIGGMNHFLLPGDSEACGDSLRYGVNAMELLVNGMLRSGAARAGIRGKVFGGARVVRNLSDVGRQNAAFALRFLEAEGIPCVAQSLGGDRARRIRFWPATGRAGQMLLDPAHTDVVRAESANRAPPPQAAGAVELF